MCWGADFAVGAGSGNVRQSASGQGHEGLAESVAGPKIRGPVAAFASLHHGLPRHTRNHQPGADTPGR